MLLTSSPLSTRPLSRLVFILYPKTNSLFSAPPHQSISFSPSSISIRSFSTRPMSWLGKLGLGFGTRAAGGVTAEQAAAIAQGPDEDVPAPGKQFAQFGAGCFWGVELAFQRVGGVSKTEVGYSQGLIHEPSYEDVCTGMTNHSEVVRVEYDPVQCKYDDLLDAFWVRHDPTTLNRQALHPLRDNFTSSFI